MSRWVVDASVAAKWVIPEPESPWAEALLDDRLIAPDLLYAEVANILWKKQQRAEVEPATADVAARWLLSVPLDIHRAADLMPDALTLAMRLQHPAHDCFYLALAVRTDATMVTADRRLFLRCQQADAADLAPRVRWLHASGPAASPELS